MRAIAGNAWLLLIIGGLFEVVWAAAFKIAFRSNHLLTAVTAAAVGLSFWFLSPAMRPIPGGTAYAGWPAIGAAGAAIVGVLLYKEPVTALRILSIAAIIGGVAGLRLSGGGH